MIQVKKTSLIAFVIGAVFLLASTSVFAGDYQTQNKIDDKDMGSSSQQSQQPHPSSSQQGSESMSGQSSSQNRDSSTNPNNPAGMDKSGSSQEDNKRSY